jgi:hypothetical protein
MGVMGLRRLLLATAVLSCSLVGEVSFSAPVALAVTPPVVEEEAVTNVAGTSATLQAKIDPEGSETTYRFEYGTSAAYGSSVPVPDGLVGSGSVGVRVSAHPQDLLSSTTYHFRVVAVVASRSEAIPGSDGSFTTQPVGSEFALPDGRQWELVSPPNKHGALIFPIKGEAGSTSVAQASEDGSAITYEANVPTELEPGGYVLLAQDLSKRGALGWSTRDISTPHNSRTGIFRGNEYRLFSGDLSAGLADPIGEDATLLSAQASEPTPYIRREALCDAPASASECYLPLLTGKEGFADVPSGTRFASSLDFQGFEGASSDLSHVALKSKEVALTATPLPSGAGGIYEWVGDVPAAEALKLVSVLPESEGGGPATSHYVYVGGDPGNGPAGSRNSISVDGSRIVWLSELPTGGERLYMRDTVRGETVRLDARQPGVPSAGGVADAFFQIASSDGSKVFFTDEDHEERLTAQSGTQGWDLYECEIVEEEGKLACRLTDLTPESEGQSAEVQRTVLGASEDGSYVYFVASGVLGDGAEHGATRGKCEFGAPSSATCNLYEYHNGAVTFITTLSADDQLDWGLGTDDLSEVTARVSPDGRYVTFMSDRSLTGYDNLDVSSGKPDMEVYLYDAVAKHLVCVSCNPTNGRPSGVEVEEFTSFGKGRQHSSNVAGVVDGQRQPFGGENWVAANVPPGEGNGNNGSLYQPRALSDSGRLFFNSSDGLVPQDVNGNEDVYEFEPEGVAGCSASSATFDRRSGGCVSLISSGTSPEESGFMDASVGGGDVFFLTVSRLTSQDYDTAYDVYDAHVCSIAAPCAAPPAALPPCSTDDSCKAAPSPQPSTFGAPASATFAGAGNVSGSSSSGVRPKSLTTAQKFARALRACARKPKRKRARCKKQAGKRYGTRAAHRTAGTMRKVQG